MLKKEMTFCVQNIIHRGESHIGINYLLVFSHEIFGSHLISPIKHSLTSTLSAISCKMMRSFRNTLHILKINKKTGNFPFLA